MQLEAQELISTCTCPEYLMRTEKRLAEESDRVRNYLDPSTEPKIVRVVEAELVQQQVRLGSGACAPRIPSAHEACRIKGVLPLPHQSNKSVQWPMGARVEGAGVRTCLLCSPPVRDTEGCVSLSSPLETGTACSASVTDVVMLVDVTCSASVTDVVMLVDCMGKCH